MVPLTRRRRLAVAIVFAETKSLQKCPFWRGYRHGWYVGWRFVGRRVLQAGAMWFLKATAVDGWFCASSVDEGPHFVSESGTGNDDTAYSPLQEVIPCACVAASVMVQLCLKGTLYGTLSRVESSLSPVLCLPNTTSSKPTFVTNMKIHLLLT